MGEDIDGERRTFRADNPYDSVCRGGTIALSLIKDKKDNKDNESVTTNPMMLSPSAERVRSVKHAISYGKIPTIIHHPSTQG